MTNIQRVTWYVGRRKLLLSAVATLTSSVSVTARLTGSMVVPTQEAKRFMVEAMVDVGTVQQHAEQMADVLVAADYRGHYSHGLNRLGEYIDWGTSSPPVNLCLNEHSQLITNVSGLRSLGVTFPPHD